MTRKDYILIADVLRGFESGQLGEICVSFAAALKHENHRFDQQKFFKRIFDAPRTFCDERYLN